MEEGRDRGESWDLSFLRMFDMSNDSALFRTAEQLAEAGFRPERTDWVREDEVRYVPLYEAKMIHHFNHRWATYEGADSRDVSLIDLANSNFEVTPRYWVPEREVRSRLDEKDYRRDWLAGWRDISLSSVERTTIGAILPVVGLGHPFPIYISTASPALIAAFSACLASIPLDYVARQKVAGTHLTYGYLNQFPILPPSAYSEDDLAFIVPRVLELSYTSHSMAPFARDLGYEGAPFAWDEDRRAQLRAELDAWYALAYGLTRDELRYVLDPADVMGPDYPSETFRVLKSNEERKFGEYRTRRLVLAAYDTLTAQGLRPRLEGYR